jgi:hypothetical protein
VTLSNELLIQNKKVKEVQTMLTISRIQAHRVHRATPTKPAISHHANLTKPVEGAEMLSKALTLFRGLSEEAQNAILAKITAELGIQA